ncbi:unnamed protein product [Ectocarpus sp. 12 AP-2014]
MAQTDRAALVALYVVTNGTSWKNDENWRTESSLSLWHGVKVNDQGRVVDLSLGYNNLRGPIPPEIGDLVAMTGLYLKGNTLIGEIPASLGRLGNLSWLSLAENNLTGSIPKVLGTLSKMKSLDLVSNQLTGKTHLFAHCPIPPELGKLSQMVMINLWGNQLSGPIPPQLGDMSALTSLALDGNDLTGPIPPQLGRLAALERLSLSGNRLTGPIPKELGDLSRLKVLSLSKNSLTGPIPEELGALSKLKELSVGDNVLTGAIPLDVTKMKNLTTFEVGGNIGVSLPQGAQYPRTEFYKWMHREDLGGDLASAPAYRNVVPELEGSSTPFPTKEHQGVLLEAPVSSEGPDCLEFGDYADVLVERMTDPAAWPVGVGVYAQWGAGKSSLLQQIIDKLKSAPTPSPEWWFIRWLWTTTGGSVVYALWAGLTSAVSCRCCRSPARDDRVNDVEDGLGSTSAVKPARVTSVVASFDAWLFADSKVLWAVLISEIFCQVEEHPCFGKGAVRATRVRHAVTSSTCSDWCLVIFTAVVVAGVVAAAKLAAEQIANMQEVLEQVVATAGLTAVPISLLLWIFKVLPVVFKGQGELIVEEAQAMGDESVGTAHLGFMADVRDELGVLLGMLEQKSTKEDRYMLVVSIDNLDRCPHRQIVKVLEAVHLLLEKDNVNVAVMLALDPRVIIAAIEQDMGEGIRREVSGAEYLDKIIHWPFCIPSGTEAERLSLLRSWLKNQGNDKSQSETRRADSNVRVVEVNPDQPGEEKLSQGDHHASPNRESIESSEKAQINKSSEQRSGGTDAESDEKENNDAGTSTMVGASCASDGGGRAPVASAGAAAPPLQSQMSNYGVQTDEEVHELENMIKAIAPTPRKAKRVYNMYSIQRALARRRADNNNGFKFTRDRARKLLRWTILSEFWPFHTACLVAVAKKSKDTGTLANLYETKGAKFLSDMLTDKRSSDGDPASITDANTSFRAEARRLMGFEESDEAFVRVLGFAPDLLVEDFDEDKLMLLRHSFNLNPAMVARVVAWDRARW